MEKETVCILIGNTDNKLTQQEWASFVRATDQEVKVNFSTVFFAGSPPSTSEFQNYCVVGRLKDGVGRGSLRGDLARVGRLYIQDSIAVIFGKTEMV